MGDNCNLYALYETCLCSSSCIVYNDGKEKCSISYAEFELNANRIFLMLKELKVSNEIISCLMKPGFILPAAIIGILKTSCAFAFLDIHNPFSTLQNFQKHVAIRYLIVEEPLYKDLQSKLCMCWKVKFQETFFNVSVIILEAANCKKNSKFPSEGFQHTGSEIAYVIQTSGSTGEPKVVQVPHHCIVPNIIDLKSRWNVCSEDVILQSSSITFDPSIIEIFLAFASGCTLTIISDSVRSVPRWLSKVIIQSKPTVIQGTPSFISSLGDEFLSKTLLSENSFLRVLAFGGESCPSFKKLQKWKSPLNKTQLFNLYGLTEISCWATCFCIDFQKCWTQFPNQSMPLGDPLLDTYIDIRNENGGLTEEGELYIGGFKRWCVINDESWPQKCKQNMRPTGDIVYKDSNGAIYFKGRKDSIIKYKGHKISLQQIRLFLDDNPDIMAHFIHFHYRSSKLFLFVVWNKNADKSDSRDTLVNQLRSFSAELPAVVVTSVPYIPLTVNGKSDVRKLMELAYKERSNSKTSDLELVCTDVMDYVIAQWKSYTNHKHIVGNENFVLEGGNSITAVQFAADIEWKLQLSIPTLVEKLLNDCFNEVSKLILFTVKEKGLKPEPENNLSLEMQVSCIEPPLKKQYCDNLKCYQLFTRRGYYCACKHLDSDKSCFSSKTANAALDNMHVSINIECIFDLKKCIDASPCIASFSESVKSLAFIGSHSGIFCCIDLTSSTISWTEVLPDRIESSACLSFCGNYVLVGCYDHHVYCFNIITGTIKWKMKTGAEVKSSPVVSNRNTAFVGSHDKHLYSIDIETGSLIWKNKISNGSIFSSPAISDQDNFLCVASLDGVLGLYYMDSGDTVWTYNYGKPIFSSPLIANRSIFVGCVDNFMLMFDFSGSLAFKFPTGGPVFSSATYNMFKKSLIFGCHDSYAYCIDLNGNFQWKVLCDSPVYAIPCVFHWLNEIYIVIASTCGSLYIIQDGKIVCTKRFPGEIFSSPVFLDKNLVLGCRDNYLYCCRLD